MKSKTTSHHATSPASNIVTLQDIASCCGVTKITVSRALNGQSEKVKSETLNRIRKVAVEMGYDSSLNYAARRLASRKQGKELINHVVALFFPESFLSISYFLNIFRGITDTLTASGFGLLTSKYHPLKVNTLLPIFSRGEIDGAICFAQEESWPSLLRKLRDDAGFGNRPVVSLVEPVPGCSSVLSDDWTGGYLLATHLLQLGHRHLLHASYPNYPYQQRIAGYLQAFRDFALDPAVYLHVTVWDDDNRELSGQRLVEFLCHTHPEITGILAPQDLIATYMAAALTEHGLRIPEDYSLVGYDDSEQLVNNHGQNILTTIHLPLEEMGNEAANLLIRRLTGQTATDMRSVLPVTLIERGSASSPRA